MYIIVGLGNPGRRYENTRHNMGFHAIDYIAEEMGIKVNSIKFKALVGEGMFSGQKVMLIKPQTYMNLSGESVMQVMNYYKVDTDKLIVIYDDIDIPAGKLRIRPGGSSGTHNGMKNIIYLLEDDQFPRIRVGIGGERKMQLRDFVIGGMSKSEASILEEAVKKAGDAALCIISHGIDKAMNEYNTREKKEKIKKEKQTPPTEGETLGGETDGASETN